MLLYTLYPRLSRGFEKIFSHFSQKLPSGQNTPVTGVVCQFIGVRPHPSDIMLKQIVAVGGLLLFVALLRLQDAPDRTVGRKAALGDEAVKGGTGNGTFVLPLTDVGAVGVAALTRIGADLGECEW